MDEKFTSQTVGDNVRRLRKGQAMTVRELSFRMRDINAPIAGSGITEIEMGRRGVSVDQLTAFATALDTSVLALLTPCTDDHEREAILSGSLPETARNLYLWLRGERSLVDKIIDDEARNAWLGRTVPSWTWYSENKD